MEAKSNLLQQFIDNIQNFEINKQIPIMLAVSGGIDSMVMLNLFYKSGYKCVVAHCNFSLRGSESDGDEALVQRICQKYGFECVVNRFDTRQFADSQKLSIEMAARDLRYNWFAELRNQRQINFTAVAHNKNDLVETFLINLTRGTGIKGLAGIQSINGAIVRPLLFAERCQIEQYASENQIEYRTDSSNLENEYTRNKFRNILIPEFKKINSSFVNSVAETSARLNDCYKIYRESINQTIANIQNPTQNGFEINFVDLMKSPAPQTLLFEILNPLGFSGNMVSDILASIDSQSGKKFISDKYILLKDRQKFCIVKKSDSDFDELKIENINQKIDYPVQIVQEILQNSANLKFRLPTSEAMFDLDKLQYPLTLRRWREGDVFQPFGMKGKKKISDFLIDSKVPIYLKEKILVLCSDDKIVWLVGYRTCNWAKVESSTSRILKLKIV